MRLVVHETLRFMMLILEQRCCNNKMPWYKIELNVGISDKLADYIINTYGNAGQNIAKFEKSGNYTKIYAFAPSQTAVNNALQDLRTRIVEVEEIDYSPGV